MCDLFTVLFVVVVNKSEEFALFTSRASASLALGLGSYKNKTRKYILSRASASLALVAPTRKQVFC